MEDNIVLFKGKKDGIVIILDDKVNFENLKETFGNKIIEAKKFFGEAKTSVTFQGRELDDDEEQQLLDIISNESNLNISFVQNKPFITYIPQDDVVKNSDFFSVNENMTLYYNGSLRSGQSISYDGSVVIYGDVNPGSIVRAKGNVSIFGTAKGVIHAGCNGNDDCIVSALCLVPVQLKIGLVMTYIPREVALDLIKTSRTKPMPSYAFVKDSQIYIQPLI